MSCCKGGANFCRYRNRDAFQCCYYEEYPFRSLAAVLGDVRSKIRPLTTPSGLGLCGLWSWTDSRLQFGCIGRLGSFRWPLTLIAMASNHQRGVSVSSTVKCTCHVPLSCATLVRDSERLFWWRGGTSLSRLSGVFGCHTTWSRRYWFDLIPIQGVLSMFPFN